MARPEDSPLLTRRDGDAETTRIGSKIDNQNRILTYHTTEAEYALPNDQIEKARLEDQASALTEMMHNRVIHVPLENPRHLIDVGCGTGIVSCYLGASYPTAQVYGIDLSPVPTHPKPPNVHFIQGDIRSLLNHDDRLSLSSVDFVFSRLLILGMSDWPGYVSAMASLLQRGGCMEIQDFALEPYLNGQCCGDEWGWLQALYQAAEKRGWDLRCGKHVKDYMEQAGLVEVQVVAYRVPVGTWAVGTRPESKKIGGHAAREYGPLYYHAIPKILDGMGYSAVEIEGFRTDSVRDLAGQEGKELVFWVTTGKKP